MTQSIPNVPIPWGIGNEFVIVEFRNFHHFPKRKTISYYEYVTTAVSRKMLSLITLRGFIVILLLLPNWPMDGVRTTIVDILERRAIYCGEKTSAGGAQFGKLCEEFL